MDAPEEPPILSCVEGLEGPPQVPLASNGTVFCVDATEVTNAQYRRFLDSPSGPRLNPSPRCAWNTNFMPSGGLGLDDNPVTNVDWCDANSYCQWALKRLCGAISTGPVPFSDFANAAVDEWYNACSSGGVKAYPYGDEYSGATCNGLENGGTLKAVAATDSCVVGGIYDLSGNVAEWENSCDGDDSSSDLCRLRGGDYLGRSETLACAADQAFQRSAFGPDVGFRCCQGNLPP